MAESHHDRKLRKKICIAIFFLYNIHNNVGTQHYKEPSYYMD